ncbi:unnamed protein product [Schistosoma margrebowiei]|uniref:Uncharacterized protein n=1 Tax=Schistosoma margrebowiei TaxID=48269 RepID=A0A183LYP0_9TREM|nr:unnamed protein product [Schistosoma margrebowiei]
MDMCLGNGLVIISQPNFITINNSVIIMLEIIHACLPNRLHLGSSRYSKYSRIAVAPIKVRKIRRPRHKK